MDTTERAELVEIMGRLREGDEAAVFMLMDRFGPPIRRALAAMARERGYRPTPTTSPSSPSTHACCSPRSPEVGGPTAPSRGRGRGSLGQPRDEWAGPRCVPLDEAALESAVGGEPWSGPRAGAARHPQAAGRPRRSLRSPPRHLRESAAGSDRNVCLRYAVQAGVGRSCAFHHRRRRAGATPASRAQDTPARPPAAPAQGRLRPPVRGPRRHPTPDAGNLPRDQPADSLTSVTSAAYSGGRNLDGTGERHLRREERAA